MGVLLGTYCVYTSLMLLYIHLLTHLIKPLPQVHEMNQFPVSDAMCVQYLLSANEL